MADGQTTNYQWTLPQVGASASTWGNKLNADLSSIDSTVSAISKLVSGVAGLSGTPPYLTPPLQTLITPNQVSIANSATVQGAVQFTNSAAPTGQQARWAVLEDNSTESGANAGSNFGVWASSDTGVSLGPALQITRATRQVNFPTGITGGSGGSLTIVNGVQGVTTGANAAVGVVGEYVQAQNLSGGPFSNVAFDLIALSLAHGDWNVWATIEYIVTGGSLSNAQTWVNTASATPPAPGSQGYTIMAGPSVSFVTLTVTTTPVAMNFATSQTVYASGTVIFTGTSCAAKGTLSARRMR